MKNFKRFLLPAFMVLAGAGSAFATHVNKESTAVVRGFAYHFGEDPECIDAEKNCDTQGTVVCTADVGMGPETLYELSATGCPNSLWEIE